MEKEGTSWETQFSSIQNAKKTVTVTYEIEGKTFSKSYDGTGCLVALVADEHHTTGEICAPFDKILHIATSLISRIYQEEPFAVVAVVNAATCANQKEPEVTCH